MQVLVVVIDDSGKSESFQLDWIKVTPNYVRFGAGAMGKPLIGKVWVAKGFKAEKKS